MAYNIVEISFLAVLNDRLEAKPHITLEDRVGTLASDNGVLVTISPLIVAFADQLNEMLETGFDPVVMFEQIRYPDQKNEVMSNLDVACAEYDSDTQKYMNRDFYSLDSEQESDPLDIKTALLKQQGAKNHYLDNLEPASDDDEIIQLYEKAKKLQQSLTR